MEGNKINVLFVCGMGVGTSTMAEIGVKNNLDKLNIASNVQHTSLGEIGSLRTWADIIVILKNFLPDIHPKEGEHVIPIMNILDGPGIAAEIEKIVDEHFPEAKK